MRVLVVEDNKALLESIVSVLEKEFIVDKTCDGDEGLYMAEQNIYDVIVLDVMLPGKSGFQIVKEMRDAFITTPVCFLTARDDVNDRVKGLDLGGDDYLTKPFEIEELVARLKALLRRSGVITLEKILKYETIELRGREYPVIISGDEVVFTLKQYEILEYFLCNRGVILTKEKIYDRVWGFNSDTNMDIIEVFIHHIRKNLEPYGYHKHIQTIRGIGYSLRPPRD